MVLWIVASWSLLVVAGKSLSFISFAMALTNNNNKQFVQMEKSKKCWNDSDTLWSRLILTGKFQVYHRLEICVKVFEFYQGVL